MENMKSKNNRLLNYGELQWERCYYTTYILTKKQQIISKLYIALRMILGTILTEKLMLNCKSIVASNQTLTLIVKRSVIPME
jgi:hypothetical protein